MNRILSLVLAVIGTLTVPASIVECQTKGANINPPASKRQRPSVTVIPQQSAYVTLKVSSVEKIAEKPGLVKITIEAEGASTVKGYHFHYEEVFVDKDRAEGSVVIDSTSLRSLPHKEFFIAHENAQVEVWLSEGEFMDGSKWKSALIPKLKRKGQ